MGRSNRSAGSPLLASSQRRRRRSTTAYNCKAKQNQSDRFAAHNQTRRDLGCALRLEVDPRGSCGEEEHQLRFYRKHAPEPGPGDLGVRRTLSLRPHWALELALQAVTESPVQ